MAICAVGDGTMQQAIQQPQITMGEKNDFVFRTLSDVNNQNEAVIAGLMEQAIVAPNPLTGTGSPWCSRPATPEEKQAFHDMCLKMAIKFLWILKHSKSRWIPTQSCIDLTTTGATLTRDEREMSVDEVRELWSADQVKIRKARRTRRHFKNCKQCGKRFLAKRANQEFCVKKCGLRWNRANATVPLMLEIAQTPLQTA
jgi:hypothetical protein